MFIVPFGNFLLATEPPAILKQCLGVFFFILASCQITYKSLSGAAIETEDPDTISSGGITEKGVVSDDDIDVSVGSSGNLEQDVAASDVVDDDDKPSKARQVVDWMKITFCSKKGILGMIIGAAW